jgi:gamma-glutamylcyclotransferase (GGCT)/AIG2-like uncharacterized protein YtfP
MSAMTTTPTDQNTIGAEVAAEQMPTILFFAYGTLRKGQRLHDWIEDEIIEDLGIVTMKGARLHYGREHRVYPYLVETGNMSEETIGELYELPMSDRVISMLKMESNAGYTIQECDVTYNGEQHTAVACIWFGNVGEQLPNNDWNARQSEWF